MVLEGLTQYAQQLGMPLWLFAVILIWTVFWKLFALWKSARSGHLAWFIVMAVINTIGILPILYIYVFSKLNSHKRNLDLNKTKNTKKRRSPKKSKRKKK